jgi:hypothetical protein
MGFIGQAKKHNKGLLTEEGTFNLLTQIDFQFKNQFECFFYPGSITDAVGSVVDSVMARLFLYSITIPSYGFEYKKVEGTSFVSSAIYPETVTMTFLEDAYGLTRRWIQYWMSLVATPYEFNYSANTWGSDKRYWGRVFKENQKAAKKNATILLTTYKQLSLYPRIMLYNLRPQSIEEVTIGHEEHDDLRISLVCSVDEVKVPWLI